MKNINKPILSVIGAYALVGLIVLLPLLKPGYILTLDMVFTPKLRMPDTVTSSYLFRTGLHYLNLVIPGQVIEKGLLFLILLLSGVGMHRLVCWLRRQDKTAVFGAYFGGLLYMINPYTYDRFMAGQYAVLLGYALLPFFVRSFLFYLEQPSVVRALWWTGLLVGISIVSIHTLGLAMIFTIFALGLEAWRRWDDRRYLKLVASTGFVGIAVFIAVSSYWLLPLLFGHGRTAQELTVFKTSDQQAFATVGANWLAKAFHVARLQGFWGEGQNLFLLPRDQFALWGLAVVGLWALLAAGVVALWRSSRRLLALFGACTIIGGFLATGLGNSWLVAHVPFFSGYREPQKFIGLVVLGYAVGASYGVNSLLKRFKQASVKQYVVGLALLGLLVGLTPVMFWGFDGQLTPRQYPTDWTAANRRLDADNSSYDVLFLPWHLYMRFQFAGRVIANPAPEFFDKPIISSHDPEFNHVLPSFSDPSEKLLATRVLPSASQTYRLGHILSPLKIKYILLDKDYDYQKYSYLDHQADLKLLSDTGKLRLYQNLAFDGGSHVNR